MSHVVVVSRIFAPEPAAASFRLAALVDGLARAGHDVTVLTTRPRPGSADPDGAASFGEAASSAEAAASGGNGGAVQPGRVDVRRARVLRNSEGYVRGYVQYASFDLPAALRLLTVRRPDIVVSEPPPTTGTVVRIVSALRRVPYVYYAADLWSDAVVSDGAAPWVTKTLAAVEGWAMRGARGVIAVLPSVAQRVEELVGPTSRRPAVEVVRHGIDTAVFAPPAQGSTPPDGAPRTYLVYAGTTSSWHGADIFIRALPAVRAVEPDLELVYLGHGSQWAELGKLAQELAPGAVHLLPMAPPEQAARWLAHSRGAIVSLKPGQNYDLAFPTKLFAAVAAGAPVVFTGVGPAFPIVADNDLGRAVGYDVEQVAQAMIQILTDPATATPEGRAEEGERLATWARANASLTTAGDHAARFVVRCLQGRPRR